MIDFQSSLIGVAGLRSFNPKSAAWIPSPSGRGIEGEGGLNCSSGREPAPIRMGNATVSPVAVFRVSRNTSARVLPCQSVSIASIKSTLRRISIHPWLKNPFLPNEPKLKIISHCLPVGCVKQVWVRFQKRTQFLGASVFQSLSKGFKEFQSYSKVLEKIFFLKALVALSRLNSPFKEF